MGRRQACAAALIAVGLTASACGKDAEDPATTAAETTTPAVSVIAVDTTNTSGYAMLNGYVILPAGSPAICTKREQATTVILGEVGGKTAASAIIDGDRVTDVTISDPEDTLTFTGANGSAQLTRDGLRFTLSGEAPGVRKASVQSGEMPMTFEMSFDCP